MRLLGKSRCDEEDGNRCNILCYQQKEKNISKVSSYENPDINRLGKDEVEVCCADFVYVTRSASMRGRGKASEEKAVREVPALCLPWSLCSC